MAVQISPFDPVFNSFQYIPRSGITGLQGNTIFKFLKNCYIVFHSDCTILHSHIQCAGVPTSPYPSQHCFFLMKPYLIVVLICISLIINDVECLFLCLLAMCISSRENVVGSHLLNFELGSFPLLNFSILCILDINPLSDIWFANIFSHSEGCIFTLWILSFDVQNFLISWNPSCLFLLLFPYLWMRIQEITTKTSLVKLLSSVLF